MHNVCASPWWGPHTRLLCGLLCGPVKSACHQWLNVFFLHFYGAKMLLSSPPTIVPVSYGGYEKQRLAVQPSTVSWLLSHSSTQPHMTQQSSRAVLKCWICLSGLLSLVILTWILWLPHFLHISATRTSNLDFKEFEERVAFSDPWCSWLL